MTDFRYPRILLAAGALTILVTTLGLATLLLLGLRDLSLWTSFNSPSPILFRILLVALSTGVIAALITEFVKRVTGLPEIFARAAAASILRKLDAGVIGDRVFFEGNIRQVAAQLSHELHSLTPGMVAVAQEIDRSAAEHWTFAEFARVYDLGSRDNHRSNSSPYDHDAVADRYRDQVELAVDRFQISITTAWFRFLRIWSSVTAAVIAAAGAFSSASLQVMAGAAFVGLLLGGPISWFTSDLLQRLTARST